MVAHGVELDRVLRWAAGPDGVHGGGRGAAAVAGRDRRVRHTAGAVVLLGPDLRGCIGSSS